VESAERRRRSSLLSHAELRSVDEALEALLGL